MIPYTALCPSCMEERQCLVRDVVDELDIRGDLIEFLSTVITCSVCGEDFNDATHPNTAIEKAFEIYRINHNLMQPAEIEAKRVAKGWTMEELASQANMSKDKIEMYSDGSRLITMLDSNLLREVLK